MHPADIAKIFAGPLEAMGLPYMITGSVAAMFYGEPRMTLDLDLVLSLSEDNVNALLAAYPESDFYCPPGEVLHAEIRRRAFAHFNLIHLQTGLKADIYLEKGAAWHRWGLDHRRRQTLLPGFDVWLAPPEYVILRKLQYHLEGGSEKHIEDIRTMLRISRQDMDWNYLIPEIRRINAEPLWLKCFGALPSG